MADRSTRPDADALLARVEADEERQGRGKLKIFLGYVAGVGKTYAMLDAAQSLRRAGWDVVIGIVETHGRAETDALLEGLEVIPRRRVEYRDISLAEMDVDAVLARWPRLVLVDELAHSNASGSRHPRRYQDVEELLAAGIDVYTTLNIQHLESLNDVVAQITGVTVRETIPDRVIDKADEIELIDLPADELIQRLDEGKVYVPEQAARAIEKFFRKGNLTALREMAMRRAAGRVDDQMRAYMESRSIAGPWPATERLLVCVSPSPLSERLVRTARRLADNLKAEWFAVYVATPGGSPPPPAGRDRVARTLHLAEELGATALTLPGQNIADTALAYARSHNITKIIAGKPLRPRWQEFLRGSVVDQLIRASGDIDVYVISGEGEPHPTGAVRPPLPHRPWRRYLMSLALVAAATLVGWPIHNIIAPANLVMLYLLIVVVAAVYLGRGPAITAAVLSVLVFDFFFVPPSGTLAVADTEYLLTFAGLLIVGLVVSTLTGQVHEQAEAARRRELQTVAVYELSRSLAAADGLDAIAQAVITHVSQTFHREAIVLLPNGEGIGPYAHTAGFTLNAHEHAVATWAYQHDQPAGRGTDTLPEAAARYLPLKTPHRVIGVLGVRPLEPDRLMPAEQRRLLEVFAGQAALAIERAQLAEQPRQAQLLQATEKLQTALLNSISHDLRTPLASITGVLSSLRGNVSDGLDTAIRDSLVETAYGEAQRLNRLVGNLLDMMRIEGGAMKVVKEPYEVQDLVGSALERMADLLRDRTVTLDVPATLPVVHMDLVLMVQVLVNLVDNAVKYSAPGTPLDISATVADDYLELEVADRGVGIPDADLARVFDKFYRVQQPPGVGGTGLGLSICKEIVEAHGGTIRAANRPGGGTVVTLALPLP